MLKRDEHGRTDTRRGCGRAMKLVCVAFSILALSATAVGGRQSPSPQTCAGLLPTGFSELTEKFWEGPWAFSLRGQQTSTLANFQSPRIEREGESMPMRIRLDNGKYGTLTVSHDAYDPARDGSPQDDCACFETDSYWLHIRDSRGKSYAQVHLWAADGDFAIVPVDLIDGPGEELLIFRIPAHASAPVGFEMKIIEIGTDGPIELGQQRVAGLLASGTIDCARWRTHVYVDTSSAKPRRLMLRSEFGARPCCRVGEDTPPADAGSPFPTVAALRQDRALRFDIVLRKYVEVQKAVGAGR